MTDEPRAARAPGLSALALAALLLATFTISASFGLVLPIAPQLVRAAEGESAKLGLHAGGLTAIYMLAITLFAVLWGPLSDRRGRRLVLVLGLAGFALSMLGFALVQNLGQLYLQRFVSGLFAAAVAPVAAAAVAENAPTDQWRASRMAWLNMASIAGFVLGPSLSIWAGGLGRGGAALAGRALPPFAGAALLASLAAWAIWVGLRARTASALQPSGKGPRETALSAALLGLTFAAGAIVGAFEVGVSLRGGRLADATAGEIAAMFAVCSLVMFITQAILFSPLVRAERTWRFLAPGFALLALGLFLASSVAGFATEMTIVGLVAASAGAVSPTLAYWLSVHAGQRQGAQLGRQTAAASLGQAGGAAAGGWLLSQLGGGAPFFWSAVFAAAAGLLALWIAPALARPPSDRRQLRWPL